jgi:selenide,water dikinase
VIADDRVLVDYRTSDDAGVYRWDGERALVQTVDFFTPIVDDPFAYGQIAATNALSDIYAMGGRPLTALAIAGFPKDAPRDLLKAIFAGGLDVLRQAGVALLGGHTVQDAEIKFGYAVTGEVHPDRVWANAGARKDDVLFLTKPLGTGIIATALKFGRAPEDVVAAATASMLSLNKDAADALRGLPPGAVTACTDITGFGLVGHASEVAAASGVTVEIDTRAVPLLPGVLELVQGNVPGGGRTNAQHFGAAVRAAADVPPDLLSVLHDPQTSGGLLVAARPDRADAAALALEQAGVTPHRIGTASAAQEARIVLR